MGVCRKSNDDHWCCPSLWSTFPFSLSSFSQPQTGYIHHFPISATHCRYEVPFIYCFHFCACILPIWNSLKSLPWVIWEAGLIWIPTYSLQLNEIDSVTQETFLICLRSESKWWLYSSAADACTGIEQCMWHYTSFIKACVPLVGVFNVKGNDTNWVFLVQFLLFSSLALHSKVKGH